MTATADELRARAVAAARNGHSGEATTLFDQAVACPSPNASILNSAATFFAQQGLTSRAVTLLRQAVAADPSANEAALNLATLLAQTGEARAALELLEQRKSMLRGNVRYWSIRANAERAVGEKCRALVSFDRATQLEPGNAIALHGRARMSLETGHPSRDHYRSALAAKPDDVLAWLGFAQALEADGDAVEAQRIARSIVELHPTWVPGLELLAQFRWAAGDHDGFTNHYSDSYDTGVVLSRCRMLAGADRFADAADVAAQAHKRNRADPVLALLEAVHRGDAGDDDRADAIFASLELQSVDRLVNEARHRLRIGQLSEAEQLLDRAITSAPDHVGAWALRGIVWRLFGDPRADWLYRPDQLVRLVPLEFEDQGFEQAVAYLDHLHDGSAVPVGQSVRRGSQTRGGLFDRHEPEAAVIKQGFRRAVDAYRAMLPPEDVSHPMLRYRNAPWVFAGSWSVRLFGAGCHVEHIHPLGLLSSAAYFAVPPHTDESDERHDGWLELGRPPPNLRLNLEPITAIRPRAGYCALFPSFLYHGTRPFSQGKRMTVAIDVNL